MTSTRGRAALPEPYQGVQRHVCRSAGWRSSERWDDHTIKNAHQLNGLDDLEFETSQKERLGFDQSKARKHDRYRQMPIRRCRCTGVAARSKTPTLQSPAASSARSTGVVFAIKDQYTLRYAYDLRACAAYANDRPPRETQPSFKRLRESGCDQSWAGEPGEMGTAELASSFGGPFCNPYDTQRSPAPPAAARIIVAAKPGDVSIGEETGGFHTYPQETNSIVGLAPIARLISSTTAMVGAGLNYSSGSAVPHRQGCRPRARGHRGTIQGMS